MFAAIHSLLASDQVKAFASRLLGASRRDRYYRLAYNAQAVVSSAALILWLRGLPDGFAYRVDGPLAGAMRAGQLASLAMLAECVYAVGLLNLAGLPQIRRGQLTIEAQGPALDASGRMIVRGPFRFHRHPTNFWPLGVLWLQPKVSFVWLGFSATASAYFLIGSLHQDARLRRAYGEPYEEYRRSQTALFVPNVRRVIPAHVAGPVVG